MGIKNLLQCLKSIRRETDVSKFKGKTIGIDAYVWMHAGMYSDIQNQDIISQNEDYTHLIKYCLSKIEILVKNNIKVVMVFDGQSLNFKLGTNIKRQDKRLEAQEQLKKQIQEIQQKQQNQSDFPHKKQNNQKFSSNFPTNNQNNYDNNQQNTEEIKQMIKTAKNLKVQATPITPNIADKLIQAIRQIYSDVEIIVAPYEADSQLAYLSKIKYIDIVQTIDSDLLCYGTEKIFFNMTTEGKGYTISQNEIVQSTEQDLRNFDQNMFLFCCIFSGCDYLDNINRIGFKTISKIISQHGCNLIAILHEISKKQQIPDNYLESFVQVFLLFRFYIVYDPILKKQTNFHDLNQINNPQIVPFYIQEIIKQKPDIVGKFEFLGKISSPELAVKIANGIINPRTYQPFKIQENQQQQQNQQDTKQNNQQKNLENQQNYSLLKDQKVLYFLVGCLGFILGVFLILTLPYIY